MCLGGGGLLCAGRDLRAAVPGDGHLADGDGDRAGRSRRACCCCRSCWWSTGRGACRLPSLAAIGAVVGLAAVCTALAYVVYFRILATAGATNLLLVTFLVPVSAILLGTLFLGETLQPKHFAGMALIGLGLAAIDGRPWRRARELLARRGTAP